MNKFNTRKENANKLQELIIKYYKACLNEDVLNATNLYNSIASCTLDLCKSLTYSVNPQELKSLGVDTEQIFYDIAIESVMTFLNKIQNHEFDASKSEFQENALINYVKKIIEGHYKNQCRKYYRISSNTVQVESWLDEEGEEPERSQIERFEDKNSNLDEHIYLEDLQQKLFGHILSLAKNDKDRQLLNYVFIQEILENKMSKTEIAEIMGCSVANITQRTNKFKEQMKEDKKIIELLRIIVEMKNGKK